VVWKDTSLTNPPAGAPTSVSVLKPDLSRVMQPPEPGWSFTPEGNSSHSIITGVDAGLSGLHDGRLSYTWSLEFASGSPQWLEQAQDILVVCEFTASRGIPFH
jgi:hypothetical protein